MATLLLEKTRNFIGSNLKEVVKRHDVRKKVSTESLGEILIIVGENQ
jgi:hypothetical protein